MAATDLSTISITSFSTLDVRFPTSLDKTGSDAMNAAGDYSAAYCVLQTTSPDLTGHGMTFTIGRGNDLVCSAISLLAPRIVGHPLSALVTNPGKTWRHMVSDSQHRWLGPEKGVMHLALGAVVNSLWDLWAKAVSKPVWQLVCDMAPEEIVSCVDFRYIEDALTPAEAAEILKSRLAGREGRMQAARDGRAVRAYTTSAGWLGYDEEKMERLLREGIEAGYRHFKLKVGNSLVEDKKRLSIARKVLGAPGPENPNVLMVDANQVWGVNEAIEYMTQLAEFQPWFIEEPTSPDDILGHGTVRKALQKYGIKVATGEMCQNRIMFKQLLQNASVDVIQPDACRLGGLNEVLAVLLLAAKFNTPVVPHSGGVGLPEYTQHISTIDYVLFGKGDGKGEEGKPLLEYVDHLHEHFVDPVSVEGGYYRAVRRPGYSVEMRAESVKVWQYPGEAGFGWWKGEKARGILEEGRKGDRDLSV